MNETQNIKKYSLSVTNGSFSVEGVTTVTEYSNTKAVIKISGGVVEICGTEINLLSLDTETNKAFFSGNVSFVKISDKYVKSGFLGKLFK